MRHGANGLKTTRPNLFSDPIADPHLHAVTVTYSARNRLLTGNPGKPSDYLNCQVQLTAALPSSNSPFPATTLSYLSSRVADLPAASRERNDNTPYAAINAEGGPFKPSFGLSGQRASRQAPMSLGAYPDFLLHSSRQRPSMWFSLKRTTCNLIKPRPMTGNWGSRGTCGAPFGCPAGRGPAAKPQPIPSWGL